MAVSSTHNNGHAHRCSSEVGGSAGTSQYLGCDGLQTLECLGAALILQLLELVNVVPRALEVHEWDGLRHEGAQAGVTHKRGDEWGKNEVPKTGCGAEQTG